MKSLKPFLWCFGIILAAELIVVSNPEWRPFRMITKPMVVGSLLVFFLLQKVDRKTRILVTTALVLSIIGDMQLIYAGEYDYLFVGGLIAFLLAHVMYIVLFSRDRNKDIGVLAPLLILSVYAVFIFWYLSDSLNHFKLPVAAYIITILIMILFAYLRNDPITHNGYIFIVAGALLFVFSDSIIAITRFKSDIPYSGILVMLIYGIAQLFMLLGILKGAAIRTSQTS